MLRRLSRTRQALAAAATALCLCAGCNHITELTASTAPASQTLPASQSQDKLPATIRLVLRSRVGDTYLYQHSTTEALEFRAQLPSGENMFTSDQVEQKTEKMRVLAVNAKGLIKTEERTLSDEATATIQGVRKTITPKLEAWLSTYAPNNRCLSRIDISRTHKPGVTADGATGAPVFPDRPLHVSDSWSGHMTFSNSGKTFGMNYKATLARIERHMGVPCARVEYKLTGATDIAHTMWTRMAPAGAQIKGKVIMSALLTMYVTLDRGELIDGRTDMTLQLACDVSGKHRTTGAVVHVKLTGRGSMRDETIAKKFPAYQTRLARS